MLCRLTVEEGGQRRRFDLGLGEHLVGTSSDCAVRLGHPAVSRRHAKLDISEKGVVLTDLDSSNGTRVDGESIADAGRQLALPAEITFGTVAARLEPLDAADAAAAIHFQSPQSAENRSVAAADRTSEELSAGSHTSTAADRRSAATTAGLSGSLRFVNHDLPDLLARLADGEGAGTLVPAVGAALFERLPVAELEIVDRSGGRLFTAERGELLEPPTPSGDDPDAGIIEQGRVRAAFVNQAHAAAWEPMLEIAAHLVEVAEQRTGARRRPKGEEPPAPSPPDPPTVVESVRRLYDEARRIAASDVGVVVVGESGTGKELLARYVHAASLRREGPFVALNCAALPRDLLESELFGVEAGAATGVAERPGRFELADGGTLFLDEIGDMALETQAKILRALEEDEVYRVGAAEPRPARVRVVAATNRDLDSLLQTDRFRRDLYHRIADWRAELPPLRRRRG
ncbi:MAG: sigma-54-dependent Fis family transcriptional regulator, partial [Thermoanaerobaculia bacterium]|nr:sigma-54-dependent Fis family transcriptional regulator [Thermoanaerobaculia bacterium]